jgi:RHS repeat-associated protein
VNGQHETYWYDEASSKFTGKERDAESGLDYFGARHYASSYGRFASPDPLMASARISRPQTWNRYSYVLNNPLNLIDPLGMEDTQMCSSADAEKCRIKVNVNVIYDANANEGRGFTDEEKKQIEQKYLEQAKKEYGSAQIELVFSYTPGGVSENADGSVQTTGLNPDVLNLVVTDFGPRGGATRTDDGTYLTWLNVHKANEDTVSHEFGHHFDGHTSSSAMQSLQRIPLIGGFLNAVLDFRVDAVRAAGPYSYERASGGLKLTGMFRDGVGRFVVPPSREAITPRKE